jgi:F-type H+-transporting ATPase subunit alpha
MEVLKQGQYQPMPFTRQVVELFAAQKHYLDDLKLDDIHPFLDKLWMDMNKNHKKIIDEIYEKKAMSDELMKQLDDAIKGCKEALVSE